MIGLQWISLIRLLALSMRCCDQNDVDSIQYHFEDVEISQLAFARMIVSFKHDVKSLLPWPTKKTNKANKTRPQTCRETQLQLL